jgi:hypothetical protein
MDNARHHRRQAEFCLQIAELMSDPAAAKLLREAATRHFPEASEFTKWDLGLLVGADVPLNGKADSAVIPPDEDGGAILLMFSWVLWLLGD